MGNNPFRGRKRVWVRAAIASLRRRLGTSPGKLPDGAPEGARRSAAPKRVWIRRARIALLCLGWGLFVPSAFATGALLAPLTSAPGALWHVTVALATVALGSLCLLAWLYTRRP